MSDDHHKGSNPWDDTESTLEVDKHELLRAVQRDRQQRANALQEESASSAAEVKTQKLAAVQGSATQKTPAVEARTMPMVEPSRGTQTEPLPAVDEAKTTNYAVPDDLLKQIASHDYDDDPKRWETMELVLEEITDSEVISEPSVIVSDIDHTMPNEVHDELSGMRTSPALTRLSFDAVVAADGTLRIPNEHFENGRVRPGMTFMVVAIHKP